MPSINMIAARRAEKRRLEDKTRNLVYAIAAEAGLFLVVISFMIVQLVTTQGQVGSLNDKIAKLKPQVQQIQQLQEQTAQLQPKLIALTSARNSTLYWYTAVQNVAASLSNTCWLSSLQTAGDPAAEPDTTVVSAAPTGASMTISGMALNQTDVGLMMLRMNQYPHFDRVTLSYVQQAQAGATPSSPAASAVQFQIALQLHPTVQQVAATKGLGSSNVQKS